MNLMRSNRPKSLMQSRFRTVPGSVYCVLSGVLTISLLAGCASNLVNASVGVQTVPNILTQPASQSVVVGQNAGFGVSVGGNPPFSYQWFLNGDAVEGAVNNTYILQSATLAQSGSKIYVVVSDSSGTTTSATAVLTVTVTGSGTPTVGSANLACSDTNPPFAGTITLTPTFSNGTAVLGTAGANSSDINASATSGTAYTSAPVTGATTYTLSVKASPSSTTVTTQSCKATPTPVSLTSVQPNGGTVAPGNITFSAAVSGGATNNVNWSATGGTFTGSTWTTPTTPGTYTVTGTSADNPSVHASTNITVSAPVITKQPGSAAACTGAATTLAVTANYASSYQWSLGGTPVPGATSASYLVPAASATDAGTYTVAVSNGAGSVTSQTATLAVGSTLTANPVSVAVGLLQPASFSVTAAGKSPFAYQWYVEPPNASTFLAIPGATASTYTISPVSDSSGSQYYAVVKDACGTSFSSTPATLTLNNVPAPPIITLQPLSQAVAVGGSTTLTTNSTSKGNTVYQWFRIPAGTANAVAIAGATASDYTIPASSTNLSNDQDGYYEVVSNAAGLDVSATAVIAVGSGILIPPDGEPANVSESSGGTAVFSVDASSTLPLSYQWFQASSGSSSYAAIPGATSSSFTIASTTPAQNGSTYYVVVSNGTTAPVTSTVASLFVDQLSEATNLCDSWNALGYATQQANCAYMLTPAKPNLAGAVMFPKVVPSANMQVSFNVTTSGASTTPGEGFAIVIGDPTLGATPKMIGSAGLGLGAEGIPGFAITFNADTTDTGPSAPFLGNTFSQSSQWANPWYDLNTTLAALSTPGVSTTHTINLSVLNNAVDVLMDGVQVFHGNVPLPPAAYLYLTAANGANYEQVVISNLTATFSPQ